MTGELCALTIAAPLLFVVLVPRRSIPEPQPPSPLQHLQDRKNATCENLRDLQFDFRTGKLSERDYQASKASLQMELAIVVAEIQKARKQA